MTATWHQILSDDPRHGTNAGYIAGCREECCRTAQAAYRRSLRASRYLRRADRLYVDSLGTVRRIRALQALGWRFVDIDRAAGRKPSKNNATMAHNLISQAKVHIDNARAIDAVYQRLSMTLGPSQILRSRAAKWGWSPPLAWDDIDDPYEIPESGTPRRVGSAGRVDLKPAHIEDLEWLADAGERLTIAAQRVGLLPETVHQVCLRAGRLDLYRRLADREDDFLMRRAVIAAAEARAEARRAGAA